MTTATGTTTPKEEPTAPRRRLAPFVVLVLALLFVGVLAYGLINAGDNRVESGVAPDFTLTTFDGDTMRLADMRGDVVVVNFWATWCLECEKEASDLEMAWRTYQDDGVRFVGIDYLDQEPLNLEYLQRYDITYPNGPDIQGRIYNAYGVQGLPETFVIDRSGNVAKVYIGAVSQAELSAEIERLLGEG
jgi:cytochrome c biogenesis protein CcmG/thiol:disulfide interchange protein DsbE